MKKKKLTEEEKRLLLRQFSDELRRSLPLPLGAAGCGYGHYMMRRKKTA